MPTVNQRVALTASGNATVDLGQWSTMPYDASVEIGIQSDATGVLATIFSGTDILADEGPVQIGTINTLPKYPDDFAYQDVAAKGEKLTIRLRDTSAGARVVMVAVRITAIG